MRLKGVYTVEAAIIISFCLVVFGVAVGLAYDTFTESVKYVNATDDEFDAVKIFRGREAFSKLFKGELII